ncbi:right-handed parallel beta-helix repeat-containing protein [uncultured Thioclava sp.]|uniref:right-handed parallel beta-helix repeat-containing protein n=1 Tax=uncultured Thioclava sp. TaxID=473858 RepID=UPI0025D88B10|nr:right-handed parallel beta-helix repeat-containing protein [uncultured Thioclava sp.]
MRYEMHSFGLMARMFQGGALACAMALALMTPAQARDWTAQGPSALAEIMPQLAPGDVVRLAAGDYPALKLSKLAGDDDKPITFRSSDPKQPARIERMDLREVSHLVFDDLLFDYDYHPDDKANLRPFQVFTARDVTIRNSVFDGDLAPPTAGSPEHNPLPTAFGLALRSSNGLHIENNEFRRFFRGLVVSDCVDVSVTDNDIHDMRMDGMNFAQVARVTITGNHMHDFLRAAELADHADMIQFWTAGTTRPSHDILIADNIFNSGMGLFTQSILMRNELVDRGEAGDEMFYRNVTIRDNVIINAHLHGITLGQADHVEITNNTLIHNAFSQGVEGHPKLWIPQIRVARDARDVVIEKNVVGEISGPVGQTDWSVKDNLLIQDVSPGRPNFYDTLFVAARTGLPDDLRNFDYLPGGALAGAGIGAPQLDGLAQDRTLQPVMRIGAAPEGGKELLFDAAKTVLPDGVNPSKVTYDWQIGKADKIAGAKVPFTFERPGNYRITLTAMLPDGQSRSAQGQIAVRDSRVLTFDPEIGRIVSHVGAEPKVLSTIAVSPGALEFGAGGGAIDVPAEMIAPFFEADSFKLSMRLRAMGDFKSAGEVVRIHQSLIIKATGRGTFTVEFWPANGQRLLLRTKRIPLYDGKWHDVSFEYDAAKSHFEVHGDGALIGQGSVSGETRPMEYWGLALGNPFGVKDSFHGEVESLELDASGAAVAGAL